MAAGGSATDPNRMPAWLECNPAWPAQIEKFDKDNSVDILTLMAMLRKRHRTFSIGLADLRLYYWDDDLFLEDLNWESRASPEAGFASEWQVCNSASVLPRTFKRQSLTLTQYFGGMLDSLTRHVFRDRLKGLNHFRFLSEGASEASLT